MLFHLELSNSHRKIASLCEGIYINLLVMESNNCVYFMFLVFTCATIGDAFYVYIIGLIFILKISPDCQGRRHQPPVSSFGAILQGVINTSGERWPRRIPRHGNAAWYPYLHQDHSAQAVGGGMSACIPECGLYIHCGFPIVLVFLQACFCVKILH